MAFFSAIAISCIYILKSPRHKVVFIGGGGFCNSHAGFGLQNPAEYSRIQQNTAEYSRI